jgi:hypothetical protein
MHDWVDKTEFRGWVENILSQMGGYEEEHEHIANFLYLLKSDHVKE